LRADIRAAHESGIRMVGTAGPGQPDRAGWELEFETLALPPLRERLDDLAGLARHLIVRLNREFGRQVVGIEPDALARLAGHWWPGNVSELAQVLEQAVLLASGPMVAAGDLPDLTGAVPASD
jgi:DNA-binding NtrC family response regulator